MKFDKKSKTYSVPIIKGRGGQKRVLIGTPMRGVLRAEWAMARWGQIIPCNWSQTDHIHWVNSFAPIEHEIANAQNIIVKAFIENNFEWLLLLEDDVILPPNALVIYNEYMRKCKIPIVSGLYCTKSSPPEPLIFRGRGNSFYSDWKLGDKVWCDGVPTGCLLIHNSILREVWNISREYNAGGIITREVFKFPQNVFYDPETLCIQKESGTSDLFFCETVMKKGIFEKAGWSRFQKMKYPFLVDTRICCKHITLDGKQYPLPEEPW